MKQVPWNRRIYDEFLKIAILTDFEKEVFRTRILCGMTITQQSYYLHCSKSSIDRAIRKIKEKYDEVQPFSDILPKRRMSEKEKYMDEN